MLPRSAEDLTPAWLSEVLKREVTSVDVHGELPQGIPSLVIPLRVSFADPAESSLELVAKFPTTNEKLRKLSVLRYEREVGFYNGLQQYVSFPVPRCFFAAYDAATGHHLLLLEHVRGDRVSTAEGCSDDQALTAVDQLAHWHAALWGSEPDWLDGSEPDLSMLPEHYANIWPKFVARLERDLPEVVNRNADVFVERTRQIVRHCFFTAPRTVTHRDYSLRNMIFQDDGRCVVFDWESIMPGRGPGDLASLLTQDLPAERRRHLEPSLIKRYHATLIANGVQNYSYEECLDDYRYAILERLSTLVSMIAALPLRGRTKAHLVEVSLPRTFAALEDHCAFDVLDR
jgi:aminoglycoside/choline kinase family phosphotransferase